MEIIIEKKEDAELKKRGVYTWPIWEKEISEFDWSYDSTEECLLLEGEVEVEMPDGSKVEFSRGDFVTFPKGLSCKWKVKEPVFPAKSLEVKRSGSPLLEPLSMNLPFF